MAVRALAGDTGRHDLASLVDEHPLRWSESAIALGERLIDQNLSCEEMAADLDRCEDAVREVCLDAPPVRSKSLVVPRR